jgi:hypothetical protein
MARYRSPEKERKKKIDMRLPSVAADSFSLFCKGRKEI